MSDAILDVQNLHVRFPVFGGVIPRKKAEVRAVDGVSLTLGRGETIGLVGESGCGKTTVGRAIVNILRAMNYRVEVEGRILYHRDGEVVDLASLSRAGMRRYRSDLQMVFQDPYSSLNPRMTVGAIIEEPLTIHTKQSKAERRDRVRWLLEKVRLSPAHASRYPHEFSGGQRQRVGIARALATNPKIVIADEPVSALDVSIQAQVINLMQDLQQEFGLSYIFISHDLSVVRHIADRIFVMYLGSIVEAGPADQIYSQPMHPYSRMLLSAVPRPDPDARRGRAAGNRRAGLHGPPLDPPDAASPPIMPRPGADDLPSPLNKPSGCGFRTRCPIVRPTCADAVPPLEERNGRQVACPYAE